MGQADVSLDHLQGLWPDLAKIKPETMQQIRNDALYANYTDRQARDAEMLRQTESILLPPDLDYNQLPGLSAELKGKLASQKPLDLAAASAIEGMTPAALTLIVAVVKSGRSAA